MQLFLLFVLLISLAINVEAKFTFKEYLQLNVSSSSSSLGLKKLANQRVGCWNRPWICNPPREFPRIRRLCCRNRCVQVSSDVNNCGWCGIRCPFTWQCCRGFCSNVNRSRFNCGRCGHRCPFPSFCLYGLCGYAQPPFPFPPRPPFPFPPFPPKPFPPPRPSKPFPPRPPFPFPPRPPKPFPPPKPLPPPKPPKPLPPPKPPKPPHPFPPKPNPPPHGPHPPWGAQ